MVDLDEQDEEVRPTKTDWLLYRTGDGRRIQNLPIKDGSWSTSLNDPGKMKVDLRVDDPDVKDLDLANTADAGQASLAVVENDVFMNNGPIWDDEYDEDAGTLVLDAQGIWSYFKRRTVSKVAALTVPLINASDGKPTVSTTSTWSGLSLGTIFKRAIQQSMLMPGGNLPILFMPDEAGIHERNVLGADLKDLDSFLHQLTEVENGPDARFNGQYSADGKVVQNFLQVGTNAKPDLIGNTLHIWDMTSKHVRGLKIRSNMDAYANLAWVQGGRQGDAIINAVALNQKMLDQGAALFETVQSRSTVTVQATLQSHANLAIRNGSAELKQWSWQVRADRSPFLGEYQVGDMCIIKIRDSTHIPDGDYMRRIAAMGRGSIKSEWIDITTTAVFGNG